MSKSCKIYSTAVGVSKFNYFLLAAVLHVHALNIVLKVKKKSQQFPFWGCQLCPSLQNFLVAPMPSNIAGVATKCKLSAVTTKRTTSKVTYIAEYCKTPWYFRLKNHTIKHGACVKDKLQKLLTFLTFCTLSSDTVFWFSLNAFTFASTASRFRNRI